MQSFQSGSSTGRPLNAEDIAKAIVRANPNPKNKPVNHIVDQHRVIVDTHLDNVSTLKSVILREPVKEVAVVAMRSYMVTNALMTIVTGVNDTFFTAHTGTGGTPAAFTLTHVLPQGVYDAANFATTVASTIQGDLIGQDVYFATWTVTGTVSSGGLLRLTIDPPVGQPALLGQTFTLSTSGSRACRGEYFGLSPNTIPAYSKALTLTAGAGVSLWESLGVMNMNRTNFLTVRSDLGCRTRVGPGRVFQTLAHIPMAGVPYGMTFSERLDEQAAHVIGEPRSINNFTFDIMDDQGLSVLSEFGQIPAIFELIFYHA